MNQLRLRLDTFPVHELAAPNKRSKINDAIKAIYDDKSDEINNELFNIYNSNYHSAITAVFGDRKDELPQLFKINLSRLAAAKTFRATAEIDRSHATRDGEQRSWEKYKEAADKIVHTYNRNQVTEYNTFVARARTAEQFERFSKNAHIFPNLRWIKTLSSTPRELHLSFVNLVLPKVHPFWTQNQPGNLYNCKCDIEETDDPISKQIPTSVQPATGLEGNPYVTNKIVSDEHPYFKDIRNTHPHIMDVGVLMQPDDIAYLRQSIDGMEYLVHFNAQEEFRNVNKSHLPTLIQAGFKNIKFLPIVDRKEIQLRKRYFGKYFESPKCADVFADGNFVELKEPTGTGKKMRRNIIAHIGDAAKKADVVVVKLKKSFQEHSLRFIAIGRFQAHPGLKRIIFDDNGIIYNFLRSDLIK
jgi:hypothetical protein